MSGTPKMIYNIVKTAEYEEWFDQQPMKTKVIIDARLQRIAMDGHFGTINTFDGLIELKWKSGLRIYTARIGNRIIMILLGGNKNGQNRDISKAKKILAKIIEET
jgi:putative addiction module killer protein